MTLTGVSIAIATHNRADELGKTLHSLLPLATSGVPALELLIIANNCTDKTASIVRDFRAQCPWTVRYIEEPRTGLSHARNRAVLEARFDILAFLDDDVDVDIRWLVAMWNAFARGDYAAVGGRAHLIYPTARPVWLNQRREGLLTKVELGPSSRPARPDELYGVNLAFRKSWIDRTGGFRTDLGRQGLCLLGSEESELLCRISNAGGMLLYDPAAIVGHRVPPERLRRRWFWSRIYWGRVGEVRIVPQSQVSAKAIIRACARVVRATLPAFGNGLVFGLGSAKFFESFTTLSARCGDLVGLNTRMFAAARQVRTHSPGRSLSPARSADEIDDLGPRGTEVA